MLSKFIQFVKDHQEEIILAAGVILISLLSFALGFIAARIQEKEPLRFEYNNPAGFAWRDEYEQIILFKI